MRLETGCQVRAHKQALEAHGGELIMDGIGVKGMYHSHFWEPDQHWPEYEGET